MYNGKLVYELFINLTSEEFKDYPEVVKALEEDAVPFDLLDDKMKNLYEKIYIEVIRDYIKNSNL